MPFSKDNYLWGAFFGGSPGKSGANILQQVEEIVLTLHPVFLRNAPEAGGRSVPVLHQHTDIVQVASGAVM